jgi:Skp family chaperone for outer membrane proteins
MKNLLSKFIPVFLFMSLLSGSACAQGKFATVDLKKLFEKYYKKQQAQVVIDDKKSDLEKEIKSMLNEYDKTNSVYQKLLGDAQDPVLSAEERDKRKKSAEQAFKQLKDLEDAIRKFQRTAESNLDEQRTRLIDNIVTEIRTVVTAKAKLAGYAFVFDTSATSFNRTPVVLYSDNQNDITDAILGELNRGAPTDLPKGDEDKPEKKDGKKKGEKGKKE